MIVITGATGQLGRLVIQSLLAKVPASQIVAAVRNPARAADLAALGVQVRKADYTDPASLVTAFQGAEKVLLISSAGINDIDASALESLETIEARLNEAGIRLHLSEVKGPVMDKLAGTPFLTRLSGRIYLTHYQAIAELSPDSLA